MNKLSGIKKNNIKKYNLSNKGFTLVELLAVIALLAIISVIAVYSAVNVIGSAKQKSYEVSISNIEKQAGTYALENQNEFVWLDIDGDLTKTKQYFCVSVQDLIDSGYFKSDVLDSYIKEGVTVQSSDNIYLERDTNTKTITQNVLLSSVSGYDGLCNNDSAIGNISFSVKPSGWTREKEVIITYKVLNNSDSITNYKYDYIFENENEDKLLSQKEKFDEKTVVEKVIVNENGILNARISNTETGFFSNSLLVNMIDNYAPEINVNVVNIAKLILLSLKRDFVALININNG